MKNKFYNKGQILIEILIALIVVSLISGGVYYYLSKQIPKIPEFTEKTSQEITPTPSPTPSATPNLSSGPSPSPSPAPAPTPIVQKCTDGTLYGQCSANKPKYCGNGNLIDKCSNCGCSEGTNCQNEECKITKTTCLKSGVCVNDDILLIVQKGGGSFVTYDNRWGEITVDKEITKFYSQTVGEEADFLAVFTNFNASLERPRYSLSLGSGYTYGTKNLKAFLGMLNVEDLRKPDNFEDLIVTLAHEIGHYWLFYLSNPKLNLTERIEAEMNVHYWSCFQPGTVRYFDIMGGYDWKQSGANTFFSPFLPSPKTTGKFKFSPLSLYLMGLIPAESVSPMYWIEPFDGSNNCSTGGKAATEMTVSGTRKEVTIEDIMGVYGQRFPDYKNSQKEFKIQFALVVKEDSNLAQADINKLQEFINEFSNYFNFATFGKANVRVVPYPN